MGQILLPRKVPPSEESIGSNNNRPKGAEWTQMTSAEAIKRFGFGCGGDSREVVARTPSGTGCVGGRSWTAVDRAANAEGNSIAFMGRVRFATRGALDAEAAIRN